MKPEIDTKKYPYVCPFNMSIPTPWGRVVVPRGFLADGASGVIDLCKEAFFAHDRLYLCPEVEGKRIGKFKCDLIYGWILMKAWRIGRAFIRPLGLSIFGWVAWNKYRKKEKKNPNWWLQKHVVRNAYKWDFPSFYSKDAVYTGD